MQVLAIQATRERSLSSWSRSCEVQGELRRLFSVPELLAEACHRACDVTGDDRRLLMPRAMRAG